MNLNKHALATAATFHQFTDPASGELIVETDEAGNKVLDGEGKEKPVGVMVFGPGTKQYRAAQTAITDEAIERKRKKVTAAMINSAGLELIARTTESFVNFDYEGKPASLEVNRLFYGDERFLHFKDQVQEKMGDFGGFLTKQ